jgi:DNA/RNA endonuclease YhcR with UshA esterase domain
MNDAPLPGQSEQPSDIMCPSCGRFVGALTRCPHCGASVQKRLSIRVFRYAALLLGTVGLGLLWLMATHREIPLVKVESIKPTMNMAYVRIAGTISGDARIFKEGEHVRSLRFMVDDGSGEMSVNAYRAQAQALVDQDRVPRSGDHVELAGSLGIMGDDQVVMRLQVPEQLVLTRAEMPVTALKDISQDLVGNSLMIEGTLAKVSPPREGSKAPWTIAVKDASDQREIMFWADVYDEIRDKILLQPGTAIRARVGVKTYRDELQLSLARGADLEFPTARSPAKLAAGPAAPTTDAQEIALGDITADMAGRVVKIQGRVAEIRTPTAGSKAPTELILQDGDKQIAVVYWDVVAQHLGQNQPVVGALMGVRGMVNVYKEKIQVKVNHSEQLTLLDVVPSATPAVQPGGELTIAAVTLSMTGTTVTVRGTLGEPSSIRNGVTYPLTDNSGSITLLLWDRSVPGADRDRLTTGANVVVSGVVHEYKGTLELVPASARAIQMQPPGSK